MLRVVNRLIERRDSEPFRKPVPWEELGLDDYLSVVKVPMDLGTIQKSLKRMEYQCREDCVQHIRLVWANAMAYNAPGSKVYNTAKSLSDYFEDMLKDKFSGKYRPPTIGELTALIENCYKLTSEELGQVIAVLEKKCPRCLCKKPDDNEVVLDVDLISVAAYHDITAMIRKMLPFAGESTSTVKKRTSDASDPPSSGKKRRQ